VASILDFLSGKAFSNGLQISFPDQEYITRIEFLERICTGKNVIHIGFADHIDLIESKIRNNQYLHTRLLNVTNKCFGIDINCEAVSFAKNKLGISDVYCLDLLSEEVPEGFMNISWDFAILGEIIEHVNNPVMFLEKLRAKLKNICKNLIITTPNAFRISNFEYALRGLEVINTDHRYWFTPYTLMKVATEAGLKIANIYFADSFVDERNKNLVSKIPLLREDLILIAEI